MGARSETQGHLFIYFARPFLLILVSQGIHEILSQKNTQTPRAWYTFAAKPDIPSSVPEAHVPKEDPLPQVVLFNLLTYAEARISVLVGSKCWHVLLMDP